MAKIIKPFANARIQCFGAYIPMRDIKCIDKKQHIWRGKRVAEVLKPEGEISIVYFSHEGPPDNDFDKVTPPLHFTDISILGFPFWLIPKHRLLFGYDPPSIIAKAAPKQMGRGGMHIN